MSYTLHLVYLKTVPVDDMVYIMPTVYSLIGHSGHLSTTKLYPYPCTLLALIQ